MDRRCNGPTRCQHAFPAPHIPRSQMGHSGIPGNLVEAVRVTDADSPSCAG